jgi:iron complex transport system substrate-binding protein
MAPLTGLCMAVSIGWTSSAVSTEVCVPDDSGARICLASAAARIVSLSPHLTELAFAAGAGSRLVGAAQHSDHPREAAGIARVGRSDRLNMEAIVALSPDLVLAWSAGNPERQLHRLQNLGYIVYRNDPQSLADVARDLRRLGTLAATEGPAGEAADRYERALSDIRTRYAHVRPVSVFYQIWNRPLYTVNGRHWISDSIRLCGGRNSFGQLRKLAPAVSLESVLAENPDVILGSADTPGWRTAWRRWPALKAVTLETLYDIDPDLLQRPVPRLLEGTRQICTALDAARNKLGR